MGINLVNNQQLIFLRRKPANSYFRSMTDQELIDYFKGRILPETLKINRAITQYGVAEQVEKNIAMMVSNPKEDHARHRLKQIVTAIEQPYEGPESVNPA